MTWCCPSGKPLTGGSLAALTPRLVAALNDLGAAGDGGDDSDLGKGGGSGVILPHSAYNAMCEVITAPVESSDARESRASVVGQRIDRSIRHEEGRERSHVRGTTT